MKTSVSKLLTVILVALSAWAACSAQDTVRVVRDTVIVYRSSPSDSIADVAPYVKRLEQYDKFRNSLKPDGLKLQYAGNMGMFSTGPVWRYGRNEQWETSLLFGFVPRHSGSTTLYTLTLKEDFVPWSIRGTEWLTIEPLQTGIYLTTVLSGHFWTRQPKRYPGGYYWFSTRLRPNIFIGQRATVHLPDSKRRFTHSISLFYEISCCDFMLIQRATNSSLKPGDYLTLSLGLQLTWL